MCTSESVTPDTLCGKFVSAFDIIHHSNKCVLTGSCVSTSRILLPGNACLTFCENVFDNQAQYEQSWLTIFVSKCTSADHRAA
jgi:hypothetical protein